MNLPKEKDFTFFKEQEESKHQPQIAR